MNERLEKGFRETTRGAGCSPTERRVEAARMDERMQDEWRAWQDFVREFGVAVGDINAAKYNPLVKAARRWGEHLAWLRRRQDEQTAAKVFDDADAAYNGS